MSEPSSILEQPDPNEAGPWRSEVQERLQRYKSRRGRRIEGAYTMRFPFPPPEPEPPVMQTALAVEEPAPLGVESEPEPIIQPFQEAPVAEEATSAILISDAPAEEVAPSQPETAAAQPDEAFELAPAPPREFTPFVPTPRPRPRRKVIAFPQPTYASAAERHRLADPVASEQLRILDVPEELEAVSATPFLDGLLDPAPRPATAAAAAVELPCPAAKRWKRVQAGLLDLCLLILGAMIFAGSSYRFLPHSMTPKITAIATVVVCVLLWTVYQYIFLVYAGSTPGMKATGIKLTTFKGSSPKPKQRRTRVFSLYLSALSLGMGLFWSLADVDSLCWHDRMSQTFPVSRD